MKDKGHICSISLVKRKPGPVQSLLRQVIRIISVLKKMTLTCLGSVQTGNDEGHNCIISVLKRKP